MTSASDTARPNPAGVTIVTQTRVVPDKAEAFANWQRDVSGIVAAQPGFIEQTILPPNPPTQLDWVILQRFATTENAVAWLRSDMRGHALWRKPSRCSSGRTTCICSMKKRLECSPLPLPP